MKERLAMFLKSQKLTSRKLAERIGVQPSGISHIISGRNKPGFDFLVKMMQVFPDLNPDWLLLGNGDMYRDSDSISHGETLSANKSSETFPSNTETVVESTLFGSTSTTKQMPKRKNISELQNAGNNLNTTSDVIIPTTKTDQITQIIICYDDRTFSIYNQRDK